MKLSELIITLTGLMIDLGKMNEQLLASVEGLTKAIDRLADVLERTQE